MLLLDAVIYTNILIVFLSSFWYVVRTLVDKLLLLWKVCSENKPAKAEVAADKQCVLEGLPQESEAVTDISESVTREVVTTDELKMVMEKLGIPYDPDGKKLQDKLRPGDIVAMFEEQEPSSQEVKEAFGLFDKNNDGFIDAKELRLVLSKLRFSDFPEAECRMMIKAYDENGDGLIDIAEFQKLVANSFN